MSSFQFVANHSSRRVRFSNDPVRNALCSICLLAQDHLDTISPWVDATKRLLTEEEHAMAESACHAESFVGMAPGNNLPEALAALHSLSPEAVRRHVATRMLQQAGLSGISPLPSVNELETDADTFVDLVRRNYEAKDHMGMFSEDEERRIFKELEDGTYIHGIVSGAETLWDKYLAPEWPRVAPTIDTSVRAYESIDIPGETIDEQLLFITEREGIPDEWRATLDAAKEVVFIPSVHIGPFMILLEFNGTTAWVVGRARIPEGSPVHAAELDRSDLLIRLEALSDATRLQVMELASEVGTITANDIIEKLNLSQSSASRHLAQLTATGLLSMDATEKTRKYSVNLGRVDQLSRGLKSLIAQKVQN